MEGNLQIIQSLESVEPDSSTAGAVFRQANAKQMLTQQEQFVILNQRAGKESFLPRA
jgi:hypothetical protein